MRGESSDPLPDQRESFIERLPVDLEPRQSQMISVTERCIRKFATGERSEEFIIAECRRRNDDSHVLILA